MLVLSRKANQQVMIGEHFTVVVVAVSGNRVKLGFTAPSIVPIHREEVWRRTLSDDCHADAMSFDEASDGIQN
jgi:carbon storage regulator CsrA